MARHGTVQDLLDQFIVSNELAGKRRAIAILYRTLANNLANQLQDSGELIETLQVLLRSRDISYLAALNPRPVPGSAPVMPRMKASAPAPRVTVDEL